MTTEMTQAVIRSALHDFEKALAALRDVAHEAPELQPQTVTDDGEEFEALRCPVCNLIVNAEELRAVDVVERWSYNEEMGDEDFNHRQVIFDGTSGEQNIEYDITVYWTHGDTSAACFVTLPEGWTEEWS